MIKVFSGEDDYVQFMVKLGVNQGELICSDFIPSAFFDKDAIDRFFTMMPNKSSGRGVADQLWTFGKLFRRNLYRGTCTLIVELGCIKRFIERGAVHEAYDGYEVSFAGRIKVLEHIRNLVEMRVLFPVPDFVPFVFRLHGPNGVLLDVSKNRLEQLVQGIWIEDEAAYRAFELEAARLISISTEYLKLSNLPRRLQCMMMMMQGGQAVAFDDI